MEGSSSKKYGLIIPKKKVPSQSLKKPSAFAESSSEDEVSLGIICLFSFNDLILLGWREKVENVVLMARK